MAEVYHSPEGEHLTRLAAQVGRRITHLLGPELVTGESTPTTFLVPDEDTHTELVTIASYRHYMGRTWLQRLRKQPAQATYYITLSPHEAATQLSRLICIDTPRNSTQGFWLDKEGEAIVSLDQPQLENDLRRMLEIKPQQYVESLEPASRLSQRESAPLMDELNTLLHAKPYRQYGWRHVEEHGSAEIIAGRRSDSLMYSLVNYASLDPDGLRFMARILRTTGSAAQLFAPIVEFYEHPGQLNIDTDHDVLLPPRDAKPLPLAPLERLVAIDHLCRVIQYVTELEATEPPIVLTPEARRALAAMRTQGCDPTGRIEVFDDHTGFSLSVATYHEDDGMLLQELCTDQEGEVIRATYTQSNWKAGVRSSFFMSRQEIRELLQHMGITI